jgi:hypothetical protein
MRNFERRLSKIEDFGDGCLCRLCRKTDCASRRIEGMAEDEISIELKRLMKIIDEAEATSPLPGQNQQVAA